MKPPPRSARLLTVRVDQYARASGIAPSRVRNWVSFMVLAGALERAGFVGEGPRFAVKGGVALEMRLRTTARATRDLDLVLAGPFEPLDALGEALETPYQNFSFRLKREAHVMPNEAIRVEVGLSYLGKPWGSVQIDLSPPEAGGAEVEIVDAFDLTGFGIQGPSVVPCLSLPYHVAQKLHAVSRPSTAEWSNDRFRDVVDLLLLRDLVADFAPVKKACEEVFAARRTHAWPPLLVAPEEWTAPFARLARETGLEVEDLHQAIIELRNFVWLIDQTAPLFSRVRPPGELTATTWYYAVAANNDVLRIPFSVGDALIRRESVEGDRIKKSWEREPGGLALIGVVAYLYQKRPLFIERIGVETIAIAPEAEDREVLLGPPIWEFLARELIRRADAPVRAVSTLSAYLSNRRGFLPTEVGQFIGGSTQSIHKTWPRRGNWVKPQLVWDLHASMAVELLPPHRP